MSYDDDARHRYDIFARTDEERQRAYEAMVARSSSGANRDLIEVPVCADCGWWGTMDGDLRHEGRPTGIVCSHPSGRHLITRVHMKAISPAEVDGDVAALGEENPPA